MALAGRAASALFGARWLRQRLRRRCGLRRLPSFFSEVPVEVREYRQNCGMLWHQEKRGHQVRWQGCSGGGDSTIAAVAR